MIQNPYTVPLPTQRTSLTKMSNASHSGLSKGSKHSLQIIGRKRGEKIIKSKQIKQVRTKY